MAKSESSASNQSRARASSASPVRQTNVRLTRRSTGARTGAAPSASSRSARARRPTPIVRRPRSVSATRDQGAQLTGDSDSSLHSASEPERQVLELTTSRANSSRTGRRRRQQVSAVYSSSSQPDRLSWYERLLPEFVLNLTAPITGYEARLDEADVELDEDYEILERQRLKRNRRVRRRLLTLILLAASASAFMYSRGRLFRRAGVRAAVSTVKHRLEDGLARSIQETMGK